MQAASRFREDGMENPAGGMLGGGTRGRDEQTFVTPALPVPKYPDLILDGLAAAARQAPGDADKF